MRSCCWSSSVRGKAAATAPTGSSKAVASCPGVDDNRRMDELRGGLLRHAGVRALDADADDEDVEQTLSVLHEPDYLEALAEVVRGAGRDARS